MITKLYDTEIGADKVPLQENFFHQCVASEQR